MRQYSIDNEESEEKIKKFKIFKEQNADIINKWLEFHGAKSQPPIYFDTKLNDFRWLNRGERKFIREQNNKAKKEATKFTLFDKNGKPLTNDTPNAESDSSSNQSPNPSRIII